MSITRQRFDISTDTGGDFVDTGHVIQGAILQFYMGGASLDTGCDFKLELAQENVVIADYDNVGGQAWTRAPRILTFDTGGAPLGDSPPVVNGQLRLTVNQSDGATGSKTGTAYVWVEDDK